MEWTTSIESAVTKSRTTLTPILILLEPPSPSPSPSSSTTPNLQNLQSTSLHKHLFTAPQVRRLLTSAAITCLRITADHGTEHQSFNQYFTASTAPELLLVTCHGQVTWRGKGFVTPRIFVKQVGEACGVATDGWFGPPGRSALLVLPAATKPTPPPAPPRAPTTTKTSTPPPPPPAPSKSKSRTLRLKPGAARCAIRAHLPSGATTTREYAPETPFHKVRAWLCGECRLPMKRVVIATTFPRHVFDAGNDPATLAQLGLPPSANVVVSDGGGEGGSGSGGDAVGSAVAGRVYDVLAGGRDLLLGFVASFFGGANEVREGEEEGEGDRGEDRDRERERGSGGLDDDSLRYNGNSTQFGYDDR